MALLQNISGTAVNINDVGIRIEPAAVFDLRNESPRVIYTSDDLRSAINGGTVIVLDPLDDVTPLSISQSLEVIDQHAAPNYRIFGADLSQLEDVSVTTPASGQALVFSGSGWENQNASLTDELVKASNTDTTPGTLTDKILTPNDGITTNLNNGGGDENISVIPANDLAAIEGLAGAGLATRTAADTWVTRSIQGTTDQVAVTDGDGIAANPLIALATNPIVPGTEGVTIPTGTTAQRPSTPTTGEMRFNTSTDSYEAWDGTQWVIFGTAAGSGVKEILFGQLSHLQGTTVIPYDDTPPLITEGTEFFSQDVTTQTDSARTVLWFSSIVALSSNSRVCTIALFRDTTLIGVTAVQAPNTRAPVTVTFIVVDSPGSAGTYTYSGRIGLSQNATWQIGGFTDDANYGGPSNTNNQYVLMRLE